MNLPNIALPIALLCLLTLSTGCVQSQSSASSQQAQPTGGAEPPLEKMAVAQASGKLSVPVEVRYLASTAPALDRPMTLQLAFTTRVAGQNLKIEFPVSDSTSIDSGASVLTQQKANADDVIRRSLLVTPRKASGAEVRVLVSMDVDGGRYFSVFSIPLGVE